MTEGARRQCRLALTRKNTETHDELQLALFSSNHWFEESRQVKAAEDFPVRGGGSSADVDATRAGAVSVRRIRTLSSSGSSWDGVRADPGLKLMDPLPEKRRWRAFPRFPLIDDGLTGGADQARESSLADVEVSAQRFELNVIVLGNGGPGQWHWRGGRAALSAVVVADESPARASVSPSGAGGRRSSAYHRQHLVGLNARLRAACEHARRSSKPGPATAEAPSRPDSPQGSWLW